MHSRFSMCILPPIRLRLVQCGRAEAIEVARRRAVGHVLGPATPAALSRSSAWRGAPAAATPLAGQWPPLRGRHWMPPSAVSGTPTSDVRRPPRITRRRTVPCRPRPSAGGSRAEMPPAAKRMLAISAIVRPVVPPGEARMRAGVRVRPGSCGDAGGRVVRVVHRSSSRSSSLMAAWCSPLTHRYLEYA